MLSRRLFACVGAAAVAVASMAVLIANDSLNIRQRDDCDPATFNADPPAGVGPGTCVGGGDTTFGDFLAEFGQTGQVEKWRFNNDHADVDRGTAITVTNRGGEVHTFTEVEEFGGGIVPMLNDLAHVPNVAPECKTLEPDDFVAPGATYVENIEESGVEKYQCCIHPWMRLEAHVSEK